MKEKPLQQNNKTLRRGGIHIQLDRNKHTWGTVSQTVAKIL